MGKFFKTPFGVMMLWVVAMVGFMVVRPRPGSGLFSGFMAVVLGLATVYLWLERKEARQNVAEWKRWDERMKTLAPTMDVDNDGHLNEWLEPKEWEAVFAELEKMPPGERSLRQAMNKVAPEEDG